MPRTLEVRTAAFCPLSHNQDRHPFSKTDTRLTLGRLVTSAICLLLLFGCVCVQAQSSTATLSGTVTDQNGAVVPDVSISVINIAQGFQRSATTNGEGTFVIPLLPAGSYTVKAERQGFTPAEVRDLVLNVNAQVLVRIELKPGTVSEMVQVNANAPLINESPAVGTVVDRQFVQNLPLNGRSFQSLFTLVPGVTLARTSNFNRGQISVNGQRTNTNNFTVDGVSANIGVSTADSIGQEAAGSVPSLTASGGTNNLLSIDALQEFSIQTSTYAPEFGRSPGAQISLVSRAGTRDFHGTLFEYFRNNVLDANDYFSNRAGLPRAQLRQNQFGFAGGGPILLPRFGEGGKAWFDGRKHSFFFFSYEGLRLRQPQTTTTTVVSLRVRALASPSVRTLLNALPIPTGPEIGTTGNSPFNATYSDQSTLNATSFRIDHYFGNSFSLFGRFNYAPSEATTRQRATPSAFTEIKLKTITLTVGATQTLSTQVINELRFNYSRTSGQNSRELDNFGGAVPVTNSQVSPNIPAGVKATSNIQFYTGSYTLGDFDDHLQRQLNILDNTSYSHSSHSMKFGADYRRLTPIYRARDYQASYVFFSPADVIAGLAGFAQIQGIQTTRPVFNNFSLYGQDSWHASRRLTLTYGVRWDLNPPPSERDGQQPFVVSSSNPITAQLAPPGTPLWKTSYNNVAPRVGWAYQLSQRRGQELVLRGGIGLFYDLGNTQGGDAYTNGRFRTLATSFGVSYPLNATQSVLPPFPTDGKGTGSTTVAFDPSLKLPYTWQWNFTAERSLGTNQTLSAAYVGAIARRLLRQRWFGSFANPNFMTLVYVDNASTSDYHAFQTQFRRRLSSHFQALASYTWSHAIDDVSSEVNFELTRRGNADFDVRHNFSAALHYESPWKPSGFKGKLVRDWRTDLIIHAQSAYPFTPFSRTSATISGTIINVVPNRIEGVPLYLYGPQYPGRKIVNNTVPTAAQVAAAGCAPLTATNAKGAFCTPPTGTQGSSGRNILRGFPTYQVDMGLQRLFDFSEHFKFTFRVEAFNLFNHPNFATPQNGLTNALFGQSTQMLGQSFGVGGLSPIYQIGGSRSIQFSARVNF